jgi:hypothetical protein
LEQNPLPYSLFLIPYWLFNASSPTVETVGYRKYLNDEKFEMKIISQNLKYKKHLQSPVKKPAPMMETGANCVKWRQPLENFFRVENFKSLHTPQPLKHLKPPKPLKPLKPLFLLPIIRSLTIQSI